MSESRLIIERYSRRIFNFKYSFSKTDVLLRFQERERKLIKLLEKCGCTNYSNIKVLEIGCGSGTNLLELILFGFSAQNLVGIDLIAERIEEAKTRLPVGVKLILGDALTLEDTNDKYDIVYQSTVFSSILEKNYQEKLAVKMLSLLKPGGGILWYDFVYDNPKNQDVKGVNYKHIKGLFPGCHIIKKKVTLAPPIARYASKIHPSLYSF